MRRILSIFIVALATSPAFADDGDELKFADMYTSGMEFSELLESLEGERIAMSGFMAPPIKPDASFFVLTKIPMAVCPFCETAAEWPDDIVFVRLDKEFRRVYFNTLIQVEGVLELGVDVDDQTGFVSLVRLTDAEYRVKRR